jgi:hypothetical protein
MRIIDLTGPSNGPYVSVLNAKYLDGYRLQLTFNDKSTRVVDFWNFLRDAPQPWITKYRDLDKFRKFKIVNGNVNWNDYELIFPIHDLLEGTIEYIPPKLDDFFPKAVNGKSGHIKTEQVAVPVPTLRRLKARAKKEDVPLELLMQRYLEEGMKRERTRGKRD